jgi:prophage regulatory protein
MPPNPHEATPTAQSQPALASGERLFRLPQVLELTGRGRTATLDDVKAGRFPKPIKIGAASMWLHSEVQAWIAARVRDSRAGQ